MKKFNKPQQAILLYFMKRTRRLTSVCSVFQEELCSKFSTEEILTAVEELQNQHLIKIHGENTNITAKIYDDKALKKLKKDLGGNLTLYWIWCRLKKLWIFLWKHFLITIITSATVTIVIDIIQKKYFSTE